jgi:hypothetical protein
MRRDEHMGPPHKGFFSRSAHFSLSLDITWHANQNHIVHLQWQAYQWCLIADVGN